MRSLRTAHPAQDSTPTVDDGGMHAQWVTSPVRGPVTQPAHGLRTTADDAGYVAAIADQSGSILWPCGGRVVQRRARRVAFAPGGRWDEPHLDTDALSLTLRSGGPSTVLSIGYVVAASHRQVCF
ncbi:hypothetical protein [Streptomyces sp. NPDC004546]|uniref:hypothetical protein n=1 Tax=unclassified Streptomyces TaxID=2593676 RepID=UPI0033B76912